MNQVHWNQKKTWFNEKCCSNLSQSSLSLSRKGIPVYFILFLILFLLLAVILQHSFRIFNTYRCWLILYSYIWFMNFKILANGWICRYMVVNHNNRVYNNDKKYYKNTWRQGGANCCVVVASVGSLWLYFLIWTIKRRTNMTCTGVCSILSCVIKLPRHNLFSWKSNKDVDLN